MEGFIIKELSLENGFLRLSSYFNEHLSIVLCDSNGSFRFFKKSVWQNRKSVYAFDL